MAHLILHIGSHKTGTTSIQYALTRQAEPLRRAGAAYLHVVKRAREVGNANSLVKTSGEGAEFATVVREDVVDSLLKPEAELNVASGENLFWLDDAREIAKLARVVRQRFDSVEVIAYLRRQDMLALSHRKQVAAPRQQPAARFYGFQMSALPAFQPHLHRYFDYHAKLSAWREAFGADTVKAVPFEREAMKDGDAVADFFARVGLAAPSQDEPIRRNASEGRERTLLAIAAKAAGIGGEALKAIRRAASDEGKLVPARAEAEAFLAHWTEANARLAQDFTLADGAPFAFTDDFSMYPEVGTDVWTDAQAREAIAHVMQGVAAIQERKDRRKGKGGKGELRAGALPRAERGRAGPGKGHGGGGGHGAAGKPGYRKRKINRRARKMSS
ncbi:hypothetical protein P2H44_21925 [Albimonas sp. CAU 1670]|uniref:hypothetical protein n=1 Tax=Albimonas sp. CAU 1670 TaxID=3032599 RepID=UPI0023DBF207|nr:hypothetical protein [Albimonas sp. CAU 1670]MDF2235225.1 hypothetical protein [Albimonas sp. CAU 1670]